MMLSKALKYKDVVALHFIKSELEHKPYVPYWSPEDWKLLSELVSILNPTIDAIKGLEADSYPTQNLILVAMSNLFKKIQKKKQI